MDVLGWSTKVHYNEDLLYTFLVCIRKFLHHIQRTADVTKKFQIMRLSSDVSGNVMFKHEMV